LIRFLRDSAEPLKKRRRRTVSEETVRGERDGRTMFCAVWSEAQTALLPAVSRNLPLQQDIVPVDAFGTFRNVVLW